MGEDGLLCQEDILETSGRFDFDNPYVQLTRGSVPFYKPNVFHLSPTISKSLGCQAQQDDYSELSRLVSLNYDSVPLVISQIEQMKSLKEIYSKTFISSEFSRVMLYGNWPIKNVCILGKIMNIIIPEVDDQNVSLSTFGSRELPNGKIKNSEYVVTLEDGTSTNALIVRMNSETWTDMQKQSCGYQLMLGSKMKVWGLPNFIFENIELLSSKVLLVGNPNNLKVETEWWTLCLSAKKILDSSWNLRPLAEVEYPDIDLALSFINFQNIIEIDDIETLPHTIWVTDMDCSFHDFLSISLSQTLYIPSNFDISLVVFEYLVDLCIACVDIITLEEIQRDSKICQLLYKAITSSMLVHWHTIVDDSEIFLRWKFTKFTDCILLILEKCMDYFISLGFLRKAASGLYSLTQLNETIININRILDTVAIDKKITISKLKTSIAKNFKRSETFNFFDLLISKCIDYNAETKNKYWQKLTGGWKRIKDASYLPSLFIDRSNELHNQVQKPDIELLKCNILLLILFSSSLISLDFIMNNKEIKKELNKLLLGEIYSTCGSIESMAKLINTLDANRDSFVLMKKKIVSAIIFVLYQSNMIEIIYDGYLDIHSLSDYEFYTIFVGSKLNRSGLTLEMMSSKSEIKISQMKEKWKLMGFELSNSLTNCIIYYFLVSTRQRWDFDSANGIWTMLM